MNGCTRWAGAGVPPTFCWEWSAVSFQATQRTESVQQEQVGGEGKALLSHEERRWPRAQGTQAAGTGEALPGQGILPTQPGFPQALLLLLQWKAWSTRSSAGRPQMALAGGRSSSARTRPWAHSRHPKGLMWASSRGQLEVLLGKTRLGQSSFGDKDLPGLISTQWRLKGWVCDPLLGLVLL